MLRLAASLATGTPVSLSQAITSLDHANLNLIINAVRHAGGRNRHRDPAPGTPIA